MRVFKKVLLTFALVFSLSTTAFATSGNVSEEAAMSNLQNAVNNAVQNNSYELADGGYTAGSNVYVEDKSKSASDGNYYTIDEGTYNQLSSSAKTQFADDVWEASEEAIGTANGVTESTVENWLKELQQIDGVGTKFMSKILKNTRPDFVTANKIYQPFSGIVGTVLGLGAVLIMALLGIVIVADIAYIALPPVRMFAEGGNNGKKSGISSHLFSNDCIKSVEIAENSPNDSPKQALAIYFKRRVIMLIVLGICLLYLVQGQIYVLVAWILDLVSGFLGF